MSEALKEIIAFVRKTKAADLGPEDNALAFFNLGEELVNKGLDPTVPLLKALNHYIDSGNGDGAIQACITLARYLLERGDYRHAVNYLEFARSMVQDASNDAVVAHLLEKLGVTYFNGKEYDKAIDAYVACVERLEALGNLVDVARIYAAMGIIYQDLDDGDKANEMFGNAAKIAKMAGEDELAARFTSFII